MLIDFTVGMLSENGEGAWLIDFWIFQDGWQKSPNICKGLHCLNKCMIDVLLVDPSDTFGVSSIADEIE